MLPAFSSADDLGDFSGISLKALTSSNKEVGPFFLGDNSICSFPSVSSLSDHSIRSPECYFILAIIAFGAFQFIVPTGSIA